MFFITNVHYMISSLILEMGLANFIGGVFQGTIFQTSKYIIYFYFILFLRDRHLQFHQ